MILRETGTIAAGVLPVGELSSHLRLGHGFADDGAEDALLERLLRAAVSVVEQRLGQALVSRGFEVEARGWDRKGHLVLPVGPVAALDVLEVRQGGVVTALEPGAWRLEPGRARQRVTGPSGGPLPSPGGAFTVRAAFEAGYGPDWSSVPHDIARAVILLAADGYEDRGGAEERGIPAGVMALLAPRQTVRL